MHNDELNIAVIAGAAVAPATTAFVTDSPAGSHGFAITAVDIVHSVGINAGQGGTNGVPG